MSQAVSHRPSAAEVQILFPVCPCRICGGQIGTERGFPQNIFIFPCQYHSTNLHIHLKHVTLNRKTNNAIIFASLHKIVLSHMFSIQKETNTRKLVELRKMLLHIKHKIKPQTRCSCYALHFIDVTGRTYKNPQITLM